MSQSCSKTICPIKKACRERLRGLQSKITAFNERIKLLNQRGTPDEVELGSEHPNEF